MIRLSKTRLILGCCLLLVVFSSCRPKGVLSRKELADVLFDLHLTESAVGGTYSTVPEEWTKGMEANYFKDMAFRSVLRKHHLNEEKFYYSISWYSKHLNQFEKVYTDVQLRMSNFLSAIDLGQFDQISVVGLAVDSVKTRALYTFGLFRPDTIPVRKLFLAADSLPSMGKWVSRQWLYQMPKDTSRHRLFPEMPIPSLLSLTNPDSLKSMVDTLLGKQDVTTLSIDKKALPVNTLRHLPARNIREVPKNEQIRRKYQQRARELERSKQ